MTAPMPAIFLSHGAPPLADDETWTRELAAWSAQLPRPESILMISAHWEDAPLSIAATTTVPLTYDFYGFPEHYYQVTYEAPGAPELAARVRALLTTAGAHTRDVPERGLDHGAYVPLKEMYPDADIPVLQVSMPTLDPRTLFDIGRAFAPLRDEGVLVVGSGFTTHNLRAVAFDRPADAPAPGWSVEFDDWAKRAIEASDLDAVIDFMNKAPGARMAHPRTEHFAPLFVALGASADSPSRASAVDGFWYSLSKRSFQFA